MTINYKSVYYYQCPLCGYREDVEGNAKIPHCYRCDEIMVVVGYTKEPVENEEAQKRESDPPSHRQVVTTA